MAKICRFAALLNKTVAAGALRVAAIKPEAIKNHLLELRHHSLLSIGADAGCLQTRALRHFYA